MTTKRRNIRAKIIAQQGYTCALSRAAGAIRNLVRNIDKEP